MAILYFILGILFTYLAFKYAEETIWNPMTIVLLIIATVDFAFGIKFLRKIFRKSDQ